MSETTCVVVNADNSEEEFFRYQGLPAGRGDYLNFDGYPYLVKEVEYNIVATTKVPGVIYANSGKLAVNCVTLRCIRV